jgi:hypothetical protein
MAQFGSARDMGLFVGVNKELLHKYIDTPVLIYKLNLDSTNTNVYDESDSKVYYQPVLVSAIVTVEDQAWNSDDFNSDVAQNSTFGFLREDLIVSNIVPEVGDIFEYRSRFFEVDGFIDNQYVVGKSPDNWFGGTTYGLDLSIICQTHMTRQSKLNIVQTRFGNSVSTKNIILPNNL